MSYYNTLSESGEDLKDSQVKAETQKDKIFRYLKCWSGIEKSPSQLHYELFGRSSTPITSVRRAISDLTKEGKLEKTENKKQGKYGKDEYCWTIKKEKKEEGQTTMF